MIEHEVTEGTKDKLDLNSVPSVPSCSNPTAIGSYKVDTVINNFRRVTTSIVCYCILLATLLRPLSRAMN